MALRDIGKTPPLTDPEREALFIKLAVYLHRSSTALAEAWKLDERRTRALPVLAQEKPSYELPVAVANAAGFVRDPTLLRWAEELRERVGFWFREDEGQLFQRLIMECAIEHAKRECGESHHADASLERLLGLVRDKGTFGVSEALLLRAGRTEVFAHMKQRIFTDEVLLCLFRQCGTVALGELSTRHEVRLPLHERLPADTCVQIFPLLRGDMFGHQLLCPASRAHEHPAEAAAAFTASTARSPDAILRGAAKTAAVLSIAAALDEAGQDRRALEALKNDLVWVATEALHFPRVRQVVAEDAGLFSTASPSALAVRDALGVFTMDDAAAAKRIAASIKAVSEEEADRRLLPLLSLFRIAMVRGLALPAYRVAAALPKVQQRDPMMEVARRYADAGDFGGMSEVLSKVDGVHQCRPDQTNALALALLHSLPRA